MNEACTQHKSSLFCSVTLWQCSLNGSARDALHCSTSLFTWLDTVICLWSEGSLFILGYIFLRLCSCCLIVTTRAGESLNRRGVTSRFYNSMYHAIKTLSVEHMLRKFARLALSWQLNWNLVTYNTPYFRYSCCKTGIYCLILLKSWQLFFCCMKCTGQIQFLLIPLLLYLFTCW